MVHNEDESDYAFNETDCCGNGCANCVLNVKPTTSNRHKTNGKKNILQNYSKFQMLSKKTYTAELLNVYELHFKHLKEIDNDNYMLDIPAGHHIMMRAPLLQQAEDIDKKFLLRPYSPFWVDVTTFEFKILVNLKPQGPMSQYIETLQPNDVVEFRGPIGSFVHAPSLMNNIVIVVTQGVAIASALRIIDEILNNEDDMSRIVHLACFSELKHVYFRNELMDFNKYWNYKSRIYLAHEQCAGKECRTAGTCSMECVSFIKNVRYKEEILLKRLNTVELEDICNSIKSNNIINLIVSGSRSFQEYIVKTMHDIEIDIDEQNIHLL